MRAIPLVALSLAALLPGVAHAHGLWGHLHVTGWAVENMPDDELRQFLLEPEVFNALLFGAVFTDSGYSVDDPASRAYSEHTHWEPFVEDFVEWIRVNDPPPWDDLESRKRVAFLMGCASHGMQDSIFDSLFLSQVEARDGAGQEVTDPGTDGFLVMDGYIRFIPEEYIPMSTLLELYAGLPEGVTQEVIEDAVHNVTTVYINEEVGLTIAAGLGQRYADDMPWGREHYMDPEVPGSLRSEIFPTMRYQQALWARLHGELPADPAPIYTYPEAPRRLLSGDSSTVDSWVTLIFGAGYQYQEGLTELVDEAGDPVPFTQSNTRWNASFTRLIRLRPSEDLAPGAWYTARMLPGAARIDGELTADSSELRFQVECASEDDPSCPELEDLPVASVDGIPEDTGDDTGLSDEAGRCGCASAPAGRSSLALALAWLGLRRRRMSTVNAWHHPAPPSEP